MYSVWICAKCGTNKHFATICQKGTQPFRKKVELLEASDNNRETYIVVETIHISSVHETWEMTLKVREIEITFKLDTGAQANVLPLNIFNAVSKSRPLRKQKQCLQLLGKAKYTPLVLWLFRVNITADSGT